MVASCWLTKLIMDSLAVPNGLIDALREDTKAAKAANYHLLWTFTRQALLFMQLQSLKGIGQLMMSNRPNSACCSVSSTLHCDFRFSLVLHFLVRLFFIYFFSFGFSVQLFRLTSRISLKIDGFTRNWTFMWRENTKRGVIESEAKNELSWNEEWRTREMRESGLPVPSQRRALRDNKGLESFNYFYMTMLKIVTIDSI